MARRLGTRQGAGTLPTNLIPPSVSGTLTVGQTLTCNPGQWVGLLPLTLSYQWLRDASTPIGTNSPTYTLVVGDSTHTVKCQVTASNTLGSASAVSPATATVP